MASTTRVERATEQRGLVRESPEPLRSVEPAERVEAQDVPVMALITVASGITLAIGSLLPWTTSTFASVGTVSATGMDGFGIVTLILGLIVAAGGLVMVVRRDSSIARIVAATTAVVAAYVSFVSFTTAQRLVSSVNLEEFAVASIGVGLLLVVVGAIGSLVGAGGSLMGRTASSAS